MRTLLLGGIMFVKMCGLKLKQILLAYSNSICPISVYVGELSGNIFNFPFLRDAHLINTSCLRHRGVLFIYLSLIKQAICIQYNYRGPYAEGV